MSNILQSTTLSQNMGGAEVAVGIGVGIQLINVAASPTSALTVPYMIFIDNELMTVVSDNGSGQLGVERGAAGTRLHPHLNGDTVWMGLPAWFDANQPGPAITTVGGGGLLNSPQISAGSAYNPPFIMTNPGGAGTQINYWFPWKAEAPNFAVTKILTGNYAALVTDFIIEYTTLTGASQVTLPAVTAVPQGKAFIIKDGAAAAASHTITISPNVDGASLTITTNNGSARVYSDGAAYKAW
jgi:hypothetical protein